MKLNPAKYVIKVFGGVRVTAKLLDRDPGSISRWQTPKTRGGYGGRIPNSSRLPILKIARQNNLPITSEDLDFGRHV